MLNKIKNAINSIAQSKKEPDTLEYLTRLKREVGNNITKGDYNKNLQIYDNLGKLEHSLYRYNEFLRAGLKDEAVQTGKDFVSLLQSPDGTLMLKGWISNTKYVWRTEPGACDKCQALDGQEFETLDEVPPRPHPNCKCKIEPLQKDDDKNNPVCHYKSIVDAKFSEIEFLYGEIDSLMSDFETIKEDVENLVIVIKYYYDQVKDERDSFIADIEEMQEIYGPVNEPVSLSAGHQIKYILEVDFTGIFVPAELYTSYNIFSDYKHQMEALGQDDSICVGCKDKWFHANANYDCVKLGAFGELAAYLFSIGKEIMDMYQKVIIKKQDFMFILKDCLEDLRADYLGILQAKRQINQEKNLDAVREIFQKE